MGPAGMLKRAPKGGEHKRPIRGKRFRPYHPVWKAFCVASGLWFPIWLFKLVKGKKQEKSTGSYAKIDEGHSSNNTSWYGAPPGPVNAPYTEGGTGYVQPAGTAGAKYEPMGYAGGASTARSDAEGNYLSSVYAQPVIIGPIEQTNAIPLPSPSPSPAPSMVSTMTAPPPYVGRAGNGSDIFKPPPSHPRATGETV
ncbi:uncharacterized protein JN550_004880 [Neoarthrinium moseri]|uniref:uncharacterized protein n=1 Tax=Neoarthrinium moseri TaxID=1658444 RepID=UPI001FDE5DA1|nr:uncharacterized protein JN550_004880 [Neoarthrinium moseri]KAI1870734.1 hypothetical protein JN550_004880 [Neoarthrinium moseri]